MYKTGTWKNLFLFILSFSFSILGLATIDEAYAAGGCTVPSCEQALQACRIPNNGSNFNRMSSSKINGKCLMDLSTSSACFNHVPTSYINNYSLTGSRWRWSASGASHYGKAKGTIYTGNNVNGDKAAGYIYLGNHLGADLGTGGRKGEVAYNVADGKVVYASCAGGSGLTVVIEHPMKCSGANGKTYFSIYRHMSQLYVKVGQEIKGYKQKLGVISGMGGSCPNYRNVYDPHLHLEMYSGSFSKKGDGSIGGTSIQGNLNNILDSSCGDMQALCGGCPVNSKSCPSTSTPAGDGGGGAVVGDGYTHEEGVEANGGCDLAKYLDAEGCTFCGLFKVLFNTASSVAKIATDSLTAPSRSVVSVAFLIWLAIYILKSFGSLGGTSSGDLLKGILFQGFRVATITLILTKTVVYEAMDLTLNPVMQTGLSFSQSLSETTCDSGASYMQGIIGYESGKYTEASKGGLSKSLGESIICSIKKLEDQVSMMMGLGKYSMCIGCTVEAWPMENWIPHPGYIITGVFLWLAGVVLLLAFPWCLVDCVLQMCIAAAMIPCAIACFAFKSTQKYMMIVWNFFLNAMFNFVFMAIIIYIINSNFKELIGLPMDPAEYPSLDNKIFITAFDSDGRKALAAWGVGAIKVLGVCFMCWTFFDEAKDMANAFADSPKLGGSKGIGRMVGGTALGFADKGLARPAAKLGSKIAHNTGEALTDTKLGRAAKAGYTRTVDAVQNRLTSAKGRTLALAANSRLLGGKGGQSIRNDKGEVIGYRANFRAFGIDQERVFMKDDKGNWSQQKETHKRSGSDKAFETVRDQNGEISQITARDENGSEYTVNNIQARHRILGVETDLEDMTARVETRTAEDGSEMKVVVYENKDGSSRLVTDLNGKAISYKTKFTLQRKGFVLSNEEKKAYSHQSNAYVGDNIVSAKETTNGDGSTSRSDFKLRDRYANQLVNRDGSLNTNAYNEILSKATDKDAAMLAVMNTVLQKRGDKTISGGHDSLNIIKGNDGSITVNITSQKQLTDGIDKSQRQIMMKMEGNRMVLVDTEVVDHGHKVTDSAGNIVTRTVHQKKDNGIQSLTKTFEQHQDGTYTGQSRHDFSQYAKNQSRSALAHGAQILNDATLGSSSDEHAQSIGQRITQGLSGKPLDDKLNWNKNIDAADAMAGFTSKEFAEHATQIKDGHGFNSLGALRADGTLDKKLHKSDVMDILCEKRPTPQPKPDIVVPKEYSTAEVTRMAQLDRKYENKTSMKDYIELDNYLDHQLETADHKTKNKQRKEKLNAQAHTYMQQAMGRELTDEARADISAHGQMFVDKFAKEDGDTTVEQFNTWMEQNDLTPQQEKADPLAAFLDDVLNMTPTGQSDAQDSSFFGGSTPSTTTIDDLDRRDAEIRNRERQLKQAQEELEQREREIKEEEEQQQRNNKK